VPGRVFAGGPAYVAGSSYFDPGVKGAPLTWPQGSIRYYTDQGDLSTQLPGPAADAFVADAFTRWTSIATAAVTATRAGQLAEDVSSTNVVVNADGSITMPSDILPTATTQPLAVAYDSGGQVTDALLGQGAGGTDLCFTNAVFGGPDNFTTDGHFAHALVVINGNCASTSAQLPDVKYRLVRVLGRVLGVGWSQTNPSPSTQDLGGFTIMHATDPISCVPITSCYSTPDVPKMDDRASLSRLYPVTAQNLASFPGKAIFQSNTVRFHGSVRFVDANGQPAQAMQGVNVVARWIDPSTRTASSTYVASSVSGFLFQGNAGNPVTGFSDALGQPLNRWGSDDSTLEGFFDLGGLEIPNGSPSAAYQITVEPVDPALSSVVGPYQPWQVRPSGSPFPMTVTINKGADFAQDILMQNSAVDTPDWFGPQSLASPVLVTSGGDWTGLLSGYGNTDYFRFSGQANRTLSVEVTALDSQGAPTESKARPVAGIWSLANPNTTAAVATPDAFNTATFGMTRLDVNLLAPTDFRVGIADARGDGRPDYRYHARVFYGDSVQPARARVGGGSPLFVRGMGFRSNTMATVSGQTASVLAAFPNQVVLTTPALTDGTRDIALSDSATGAASTLTGAVTYGAGPTDTLTLLSGTNPSTPVGGVAPNPIRVKVLDANGVTPVGGASVFLTASPAVSFSACGGAGSCTILSDESGEVITRVTPLSAGASTITAQLAPLSYSPPQQVQAPLSATNSALDLALISPTIWMAQGATADVALQAQVLLNGTGAGGNTVGYSITLGSGTLSLASVPTNTSGAALTVLHVPSLASEVDVSACVGPAGSPCKTFRIFPVPTSSLRLEPVAGSLQSVVTGQSFAPVTARVFDSVTGNPVRGASVALQWTVGRAPAGAPVISIGDTTIKRNPLPVVLATAKRLAVSDGNGVVSVPLSNAGFAGPLVIQGTASAGISSLPFQAQSFGQ
jgi:hypothetical protein